MTYVGWRVSNGYAERRAEERFAFSANEAADLIEKRMLEYEQVLRGGVGLFNASGEVTRAEWRDYVATLRVEDYFPGIQGIGFARQVAPQDVPAFEQRLRDEGFPDFAISPVGPREIYTSIEFLEPFDRRNRRAFGYDMFSHPVRRAAMERARDTGLPAMTSKVILLQETETDVQPGVLTYLPLYTEGMPTANVTQRRAALRGYVYAPFRLRNLMEGILDHTRREVDVRVYDGTAVGEANFLHDTAAAASLEAGALTDASYREQRTINISGQPWTLEFSTNARFETATTTLQPALIAATGVVIDVLLFVVIATLSANYRHKSAAAQAATDKLTAASRLHEAVLNHAGAAIIAADLSGTITIFNPAAERLLGYTRKEMIGKLTPAAFHDPAEVAARAQQFSLELGAAVQVGFPTFVAKADLGLPNTHEWTYLRKDGTRVPVLLSVTAIRDEKGVATSYLGVATDNSELHLAQKRLAQSLARLESLNRALDEHAIVAITDRRGTITEVNAMLCRISGYRREELIGQNHRLLNSGTHDPAFFKTLWKTISHGEIWHGEICNRTKDGELYWVDTTIVPMLGPKGKPESFIAIRTNITPRRQYLEQLNQTQRLARMGSWDYDVARQQFHLAAETTQISTLASTHSLTWEQFFNLFDPPGIARLARALQTALDDQRDFDIELQLKRASAPKSAGRWVRLAGRPERDHRGVHRIRGLLQDIDDSKRTQLALAAEESRYRMLATTLPVGLWEVDSAGECHYVNDAWQEITGLSFEQALGHGYRDAVHPDDLEPMLAAWLEAVKKRSIFVYEFRWVRPDGQIRWVHSTGTAVERDGEVVGYVGGDLDITEHHKTNELLRTTQTIAEIGGWEYHIAKHQLLWTEQTYALHELPGTTEVQVEEAIAYYHPEDRAHLTEAVEHATQTGAPWDIEARIITATGRERWVRAVGQAEFAAGKAVRLFGTLQDIDTAKRSRLALTASEERFRTLAQTLPVGIFETDPQGLCVYTNHAWQTMAALDAEQAQGLGWSDHVHPEDRDAFLAPWQDADILRPEIDLEFRFQHPDGSQRWVHATASALHRQGSVTGYVGVCEDITERKKNLDRITDSLAEKEVLLREIHHRVKNNLQLVKSLLNLQANQIHDEAVLEPFRESQRRIQTMAMVHEMLYAHTDLARIELDTYLRQLAQSLVRTFTAPERPIHLHLDLEPIALPPDTVVPLGLIANEILTNACKYGRQDGAALGITLRLTRSPADGAALHFSNDGPPLPASFDPETSKTLGFRLIRLLSKQARVNLQLPAAGSAPSFTLSWSLDHPDEPTSPIKRVSSV